MNTVTIVQQEKFQVSPAKFYETFLNSKAHSAFTGSEAQISDQVGDSFSAHGGYCFGKNLELEVGKKIVQSWTAYDDNWIEGHESKITLLLSEEGGETALHFTHEDVPEAAAESIAKGWIEYYWAPMRDYFAEI